MPQRHTILFIIAFWLGTNGWLFYRDLWPRLAPGSPPPFTLDLADEAQAHDIRWKVLKNGRRMGYAKTGADYDEKNDTFQVWGEFKLWYSPEMKGQADLIFKSRYVVTREGDLRHVHADGTANVAIGVATVPLQGEVDGPVEKRLIKPHVRLTGLGHAIERDLDPVPIAPRGSVLNPLQPINRIAGLRPGHQWIMPLVDPMEDILSLAGSMVWSGFRKANTEPHFLRASVGREPQKLRWSAARTNADPEICLVIEYTGDDLSAETWVRELDGLVLRQQVTRHGETLLLERDTSD